MLNINNPETGVREIWPPFFKSKQPQPQFEPEAKMSKETLLLDARSLIDGVKKKISKTSRRKKRSQLKKERRIAMGENTNPYMRDSGGSYHDFDDRIDEYENTYATSKWNRSANSYSNYQGTAARNYTASASRDRFRLVDYEVFKYKAFWKTPNLLQVAHEKLGQALLDFVAAEGSNLTLESARDFMCGAISCQFRSDGTPMLNWKQANLDLREELSANEEMNRLKYEQLVEQERAPKITATKPTYVSTASAPVSKVVVKGSTEDAEEVEFVLENEDETRGLVLCAPPNSSLTAEYFLELFENKSEQEFRDANGILNLLGCYEEITAEETRVVFTTLAYSFLGLFINGSVGLEESVDWVNTTFWGTNKWYEEDTRRLRVEAMLYDTAEYSTKLTTK